MVGPAEAGAPGRGNVGNVELKSQIFIPAHLLLEADQSAGVNIASAQH